MIEILSGVEIIELCLYFRNDKVLVIGDVHLGFEETLNKQGILVPRFQFEEVMQRIRKIIQDIEVDKVIFNGDIKHEFGTISETEWRHSIRLLDLLLKYSKEVIFIKGNHDKVLGPIANKRKVKIVDYYMLHDTYICHGHIIPKDNDYVKATNVIIGHEHPAVSLIKDGRTEKFKCYIKGKYNNKNLIVMPSFNLVTEGTNLLKEFLLSPFLKELKNDILDFELFIVGSDAIYPFGKLKNVKKL